LDHIQLCRRPERKTNRDRTEQRESAAKEEKGHCNAKAVPEVRIQ